MRPIKFLGTVFFALFFAFCDNPKSILPETQGENPQFLATPAELGAALEAGTLVGVRYLNKKDSTIFYGRLLSISVTESLEVVTAKFRDFSISYKRDKMEDMCGTVEINGADDGTGCWHRAYAPIEAHYFIRSDFAAIHFHIMGNSGPLNVEWDSIYGEIKNLQ